MFRQIGKGTPTARHGRLNPHENSVAGRSEHKSNAVDYVEEAAKKRKRKEAKNERAQR